MTLGSRVRAAAAPGLAWVAAHRRLSHGLGAAAATLGGVVLLAVGQRLNRDPQHGHDAPYLYMITVFPFFGAALAEALRAATQGRLRLLAAELLVLTAAAFLRLLGGVPASGHVMMQVWFVLRIPGLCAEDPALGRVERGLGAVALASYVAVKLFAWGDWVSPLLGALLGAAIAAPALLRGQHLPARVNAP